MAQSDTTCGKSCYLCNVLFEVMGNAEVRPMSAQRMEFGKAIILLVNPLELESTGYAFDLRTLHFAKIVSFNFDYWALMRWHGSKIVSIKVSFKLICDTFAPKTKIT